MFKYLLLASALFITPGAIAHNDDAYSHDPQNMNYTRNSWMSDIADNTPVWQLSIPGTHDSGSRHGGDSVANQVMTIDQQLNSGIRYLDIRVRHIDNAFAIHHSFVYQKLNFDDVMKQATAFLTANPREIVFMRVRDEYEGTNNTRQISETFGEYIKKYRPWVKESLRNQNIANTPVKELRGKIYFLFDNVRPMTSFNVDGTELNQVNMQDDFNVTTNWDLYDKWGKVKNFVEKEKSAHAFSINHLSASGGSFPYFIASGHSSNGTGAPRLATGLTTPGWKNHYPDFPRVSCFVGICTIAFEGTNTLTKNYLNKNSLQRTGVIAADFPGQGLIDAIVNKNVFASRQYVVQATNQCMSVAGGNVNDSGRRIIIEDCNKNASIQNIIHQDNQLMIGSQCVDLLFGRAVKNTPLVIWPCGNSANQKWYREGNMFRSAMPGTNLCIDLGDDRRSLEVFDCWQHSADQQFSAIATRKSANAAVSINSDEGSIVAPDYTNAPLFIRQQKGTMPGVTISKTTVIKL